jgi:hypothetical protein
MPATSSYPRCQATLKDGSACRTHTAPGSDYCAYHTRQLTAEPTLPQPEEVSAGQEADTIADSSPARGQQQRGVPVGDVRAQLARDTAEEYELLRGALLDALRAEREAFVTCPNCDKRHPVVVPDWTARVKAVETLLNQGFGAKPEPEEHWLDREWHETREFYGELDEEERFVLGIAGAARRLEDNLSSRSATADERKRLRAFLIELFQLDDEQQALFHRLLDASPRIWSFVDELREQILAHRNEK